MFTLGGWWGMDWREKVIAQNCGRALVKPWRGCAGSLMAEMNTLWTFGLLKQAATLDIVSPDTCQSLIPPFEPFTSP